MKNAVVVIDGANLMHRCKAAWYMSMGGRVTDQSQLQGWPIVFMFIRSLRALVEDLSPAWRFVYALEATPASRINFYSGYKRKRHEKNMAGRLDFEHHKQLGTAPPLEALVAVWEARQLSRCLMIVQETLPFVSLCWQDHEADDICAAVAQAFPDRPVVIASSDSDMKQLQMMSHVRVYNLGKKCYLPMLDPEDVADQDPARFKAITGDSTDEIGGCTGEITARKLLVNGTLEEALDTKKKSSKDADNGKSWREIYERNIKLVTLVGDRRLVPLRAPELVRQDVGHAEILFHEEALELSARAMKFDSWIDPSGKKLPAWDKQVKTWTQTCLTASSK